MCDEEVKGCADEDRRDYDACVACSIGWYGLSGHVGGDRDNAQGEAECAKNSSDEERDGVFVFLMD